METSLCTATNKRYKNRVKISTILQTSPCVETVQKVDFIAAACCQLSKKDLGLLDFTFNRLFMK